MKKTILAVSLALIAGSALACDGIGCPQTGAIAGGAAASANLVGAYSYSANNGSSLSAAGQYTGTSVQTNVTESRIYGHSYDVPQTQTTKDVELFDGRKYAPTMTVTEVTTGSGSKTTGAQVSATGVVNVVTDGYAFNKSEGHAGGGAIAAGAGLGVVGVAGYASDSCNGELAGFGAAGAGAAGNLEMAGRNQSQAGGAAAVIGVTGSAGVETTKTIGFTNTEVDKYAVSLCKPPKLLSHEERSVLTHSTDKAAWANDTKEVQTSSWQDGNGFGVSGAAGGAIGGNFALVNDSPVNASLSDLTNRR